MAYSYQFGARSGVTLVSGYNYYPNDLPVANKGLFFARAGYQHYVLRTLSLSGEFGYGDAIYVGGESKIHYRGLSFGSTVAYHLSAGGKRTVRPHIRFNFIQLLRRYQSEYWFQTFDIGVTYGLAFGGRTSKE